jgi:cytochrome P450
VICYEVTGTTIRIGEFYRKVSKNVQALRDFVGKFVRERKDGLRKSQVDGKDMMEVFLENRDIFTDEFIIDEVLDFFAAGSLTTMNGSQTILAHFAKSPESLGKVRQEFDQLLEEKYAEDPSIKELKTDD